MEAMVESEHLRIVNAEAVQLVHDYMLHPEDHMLHPKRFSNSITNSVGKECNEFEEKKRCTDMVAAKSLASELEIPKENI